MARIADGPASAERREQILEAAMRVFARKGYGGATNKDIALEAGITPGLIYHYFEDKRALFEAIFVERSPIAISQDILSSEDALDLEPRALMIRLVTAIAARLESGEYGPAFRAMVGEMMRDPDMAAMFSRGARQVVGLLSSYLQRQIERGRVRPVDPFLTAQLLFGSLVATMMKRTMIGDVKLCSYSHEQIATALVDLSLYGLEPRGT